MRQVKTAVLLACALMVSASFAAGLTFGREKLKGPNKPVAVAPDTSVTSLIANIPLDQGFAQWQQWLKAGSNTAGVNEAKLVPDSTYGSVAQFSRTEGGSDSGAAGIYQSLNATASKAHVYVEGVVKVISQAGGNIANTNPQLFPEGAVQVRVKYLAPFNKPKEWYHGFYTGTISGVDVQHFTKVGENAWFTYKSPDLKTLPGGFAKITEIRVYGYGWNFNGQVAKINLYNCN
jgi:hypothetical protein